MNVIKAVSEGAEREGGLEWVAKAVKCIAMTVAFAWVVTIVTSVIVRSAAEALALAW